MTKGLRKMLTAEVDGIQLNGPKKRKGVTGVGRGIIKPLTTVLI